MYKIEFSRTAEKELVHVYRSDRTLYKRLLIALEDIRQSPTSGKPLQHTLHGLRSYRFGSYRILYETHQHKLLIIVIDLGHRRDIYR